MWLSVNLVALLPGITLTAVGLFGDALILRSILKTIQVTRDARRSRSWPAVQGHVVKVTSQDMVSNCTIDIEYTYLVDGVHYTGNRFAFSIDRRYTRHDHDAILNNYKPRKPVTVYYDADNPQESTLQQEPIGVGSSLFVSALLLLFPTVFLFLGLFAIADDLKLIK